MLPALQTRVPRERAEPTPQLGCALKLLTGHSTQDMCIHFYLLKLINRQHTCLALFSFVLSLVSLAYRVLCAMALFPAIQTRVRSLKWLHLILEPGGLCAEVLRMTLWLSRAVCRDSAPGNVIWSLEQR